MLYYFFFFKQKTAYEMRISDWSSDVCSSDLYFRYEPAPSLATHSHTPAWTVRLPVGVPRLHRLSRSLSVELGPGAGCRRPGEAGAHSARPFRGHRRGLGADHPCRSEEHTSELTSLMRSSNAVF